MPATGPEIQTMTGASAEQAPGRSLIPERYLSIVRIAIATFKFVLAWRHDLYRLLWPFVFAEFVGMWGWFLSRSPLASASSKFIGDICLVLALVVLIPLAARVQRFALDPKPVDRWELWQFGRDEGLLIWAAINQFLPIFFSFCFFGTIIIIVDGGKMELFRPLPLSLAVCTAVSISVFLSRLLIIYPLTLSTGRPSVRASWQLTRGHYIRLLLILGFSTLPFRFIYRMGALVDAYVWSDMTNITAQKMAIYIVGGLIPTALSSVGQILMTLIAVTLVYKELCAEKGWPPRGDIKD
ncbi:MAG: hypothetical protein EP347_10315 [Alphaproteobacteria bacterium]|nr:MAG: hypothetical protein EP347_10315 [Alphaproteobacteria bacterium]